MAMYGADADALDALATLLDQRAADLDGIYRRLGRQMYAAPWQGQGADQFRGRWNTVHGRQVSDATGFLRAGARILHDNARQQRSASDSGTGLGAAAAFALGGGAGGSWGGSGVAGAVGVAGTIMSLLGVPHSAYEELAKVLKKANPKELKELEELLKKNGGKLSLLNEGSKYLGVAGAALGFFSDFIGHHGPVDEKFVHAGIQTLASTAETQVAGELMGDVGAFVGGLVTLNPVGVAVGFFVGEVVGQVGMTIVDNTLHISEHIADAGLDAYQFVKHSVVAPVVNETVHVVDGAIHEAGNFAAGAAHEVGHLASGAEHAVGSAWHSLWD